MTFINASSIGEPALRLVQTGGQVYVTGVTSKGVFLQNDLGHVLFLSFEGWRGPLTINLAPLVPPGGTDSPVLIRCRKTAPPFDQLPVGSQGDITADGIVLHSAKIRIAIHGIAEWRAEIPSPEQFDWNAIQERLRRVTRLVSAASTGKGWSGLFSHLEGEVRDDLLSPELTTARQALSLLKQAYRAKDAVGIATIAETILGRGGGLTPSGDDVLVGWLIGSRWVRSDHAAPVPDDAEQIVALARRKTTALSASLLACAVDGQADERITTTLHAILTGSIPAAECARRLLSYGGSSGGDTLLGITLALTLH